MSIACLPSETPPSTATWPGWADPTAGSRAGRQLRRLTGRTQKFDIRTDDAPQKPLVESIKERGQLTPVWVRSSGNGDYELISGHRRLSALKSIKHKTVLARVFNGLSYKDALNLAITENVQRKNLTPLDKAMLCLHLQEKGRKRSEIAFLLFPNSKAKDKERTVQNYLLIAKTDPLIREALSKGHIGLSHAMLLAKYLLEMRAQENVFLVGEALEYVIDTVKRKDLSVRQSRELIEQCIYDQDISKVARKRNKSQPVIFREGSNGNWTLKVNFNTSKCVNDLNLAIKIKTSLEDAISLLNNFIMSNSVNQL